MSTIVRFDSYEVDLPAGQLYKNGIRINLREKSFQILAALLNRSGEVVTREDLRRELWHDDTFVDFDNNLNTAMARLREALCDSADHSRFIETLPKRGYRFIGQVSFSEAARMGRRIRLLVLPFVNLSGDPAQEYLSDATTDEMITELARFSPQQLAVIARTTAMHYKGTPMQVSCIGQELGVDYVVEGAVRLIGRHVGVNVQLIRVTDQAHMFAGRYESEFHDPFGVHRKVARDVAGCMGIDDGSTAGGRDARKPTRDLVAYREYIRARPYLSKATPESFSIAKKHLETAIARDPEFADAYDALAEGYWYLGYVGYVAPRKAFSTGIVFALRALEIENNRAETHALLGQFHKISEYNWDEVEREMAIAIQLEPNSPVVRMRYAVSGLMPQGRLEEAAAQLERALEFDPLCLLARYWLSIMHLLSRRYEEGIEEGRKLLDLDPNLYLAYFSIAGCLRYQKRFQEAIASQRMAVELSNNSGAMLGWLGMALAENDRTAEARNVLRQLQAMAATRYVPPCSLAWVHLALREIDIAFEYLDQAVDECDQLLMPIKSYGFFDPIRSDPRFVAILRKMNLQSGGELRSGGAEHRTELEGKILTAR